MTKILGYLQQSRWAREVHLLQQSARPVDASVVQPTLELPANPETQMPPSPLELWYNMHFRAEKDRWLNDHSRIQYDDKASSFDNILNSEKDLVYQ
ncbi:hypothetical protein L1987_23981 [Smallanthus sonchifolius]|uniref:Uncharacterized protein n=1 Tax=Smallanthus sonchifolius TaxID=185202 RepID=A0ACB9IKX2_9ASTR|nr:hypothetical protein L1987_23981 [Smallanthus sonchifolius]